MICCISSLKYSVFSDDHSRVKLQGPGPKVVGSDYINANYVDVSTVNYKYFLLFSDLQNTSFQEFDAHTENLLLAFYIYIFSYIAIFV